MIHETGEPDQSLPEDRDEVLFSTDWSLRLSQHRRTLNAALGAMEDIVADTSLTSAEKIKRVNQLDAIIDRTSALGKGAAILARAAQARTAEIFGIE